LIFFMLSMNFKSLEGSLLSQLPKGKGTDPSPVPAPELREVRLVLCGGEDADLHVTDKGAHLRTGRTGMQTRLWVERTEIGVLRRTEAAPDSAAANRALLKAAATAAKGVLDLLPPDRLGRQAPVVLDADPEVPYEHVLGAVDACKALGLGRIEFVADPRRK
jgi:hypothetical protein